MLNPFLVKDWTQHSLARLIIHFKEFHLYLHLIENNKENEINKKKKYSTKIRKL